MPLSAAQKTAIDEVITVITSTKDKRGRRNLSDMFLEMVNKDDMPEYYEVIPAPRCIEGVRTNVSKNKYRSALDAFTDLSLVFWNALYFNEPTSSIAKDAETLKTLLESEWASRSTVLPTPRSLSPPRNSAQKVKPEAVVEEEEEESVEEEDGDDDQYTPASPTPAPTAQPSAPITAPVLTPAPLPIQFMPPNTGPVHSLTRSQTANVQSQPSRPSNTAETEIDIESHIKPDDLQDSESERIVQHLDASLPRWPGFGEDGWAEVIVSPSLHEIVHVIKSHKDIVGNRLAVALEAVPEQTAMPCTYKSKQLSLKLIEARVRDSEYASHKAFDIDMSYLFYKCRRWHVASSEAYGRVLILQRLYQALISKNPPSGGPTYTSPTSFASLSSGPGNAKADGSDVTSPSLKRSTRPIVEQVAYKGWSISSGDWVHLSNPDDPSRPIVGQVQRCFEDGITVIWYFRPEQTFHVPTRRFWQHELFSSNHFAEHPLPDIIEKVYCQPFEQHILGRPRGPRWFPDIPLYTYDSGYDDVRKSFHKLSGLLLPTSTIYPFEDKVYPSLLSSPLTKQQLQPHVRLTGALLTYSPAGCDAGRTKRISKTVSQVRKSIPATVMSTLHGASTYLEVLPSDTTKHFDVDPETKEILWFPSPPAFLPSRAEAKTKPKHSLAYLHALAEKRKRKDDDDENQQRVKVMKTVRETLSQVLQQ